MPDPTNNTMAGATLGRVLCHGASLTAGFTAGGFFPFGRVVARRLGVPCDVGSRWYVVGGR